MSHSRIETFKKCPHQFKLRYIDGLQTYFNCEPANPLVVGTALHTGIEKDTETAIKEYYANYPIISDLHVEEAIKLESVIQKCRDALPPLDNALFETKIECPEFIGFIDLLVPVEAPKETKYQVDLVNPTTGETKKALIVDDAESDVEWFDMYDFKYSNNVKNYMKSGQLHEYKFYFEKLNPKKRIRNMYFLFAPKVSIRKKRKNKTNNRDETTNEFRKRISNDLKKDAQLIEVVYDPEKVREFLRNAKECKTATSYPKQPTRLCDWCEFQKYCEESEDLEIMTLPVAERRTVAANDHKKIWFYGTPFSGKTYLANEFPMPLMLNTDGNIKYVDAPYIALKDVVTTEGRITKRKYAWEVFKETIDELEKGNNDFETIVVDLLEDVYDHCRVATCDAKGWEHESDDSFKAYDIVRSEFLRTLKRLLNLDYNIVLISHEDTSRDITKKSSDKVTAIKPNIAEKIANKVAGMVDIVARTINDDGVYKVSFKTNEVVFGGGRLTISEKEIDSDYDELCKIYDKANKGKKKPEPKKEVAATKEEEATESEPETTDAPPVETETADAPPTRKRRTSEPETKEEPEAAKTKEETTDESPAPRRRRRKTE